MNALDTWGDATTDKFDTGPKFSREQKHIDSQHSADVD